MTISTHTRRAAPWIVVGVLCLLLATSPEGTIADPCAKDVFAFRIKLERESLAWTPLPCREGGNAGDVGKSFAAALDAAPRGDQLGAAERKALVEDLSALACYFSMPDEAGYVRVVDPNRRIQIPEKIAQSRKVARTAPFFKGRIQNPESDPIEKFAAAMMEGFHEGSRAPAMRGVAIGTELTVLRFGSVPKEESVTATSVMMPHPGICDASYGVGGRIYDSSMDYAAEINAAIKRDGAVRFVDVIFYLDFENAPDPSTAGATMRRVIAPLAMRLYYNSENNRWYPVNGFLGADMPRLIVI